MQGLKWCDLGSSAVYFWVFLKGNGSASSQDIILGYDLLNSHLNAAITCSAALKIGAKRGASDFLEELPKWPL